MSDVNTRLAGPSQLGTGAATVYTVPASTTATLLHILACNTNTVAAKLTMSIGADAANKRFVNGITIAPNVTWEWKGYLVMTAAEILQAYSDTASSITLTVSGVTTT